MEQRGNAELRREKKPLERPKRDMGHVLETTVGRTCHVDIAAHDVQAKAACVQAFLHGNIKGLPQRPRALPQSDWRTCN